MKRKWMSISLIVVLLLTLLIGSPGVQANSFVLKEVQANEQENIRWAVYTDPVYGISIEYPTEWAVVSPTGKGIGETISFHPPDDNSFRVEVGLYLSERDSNTSLEDWTNLYDDASHTASGFNVSDILINSTQLVKSEDGENTLYREGLSPLTQFKYTNIPRDRTVWFIWANSWDAHDKIYDHMVSSFKFNEYAPRSLQEIYGTDFQPVQLHAVYNTLRNPVHPQSPTILIPTDPFGYRLPFLGNKTITAGPGCYHTHQGASSEAIDYSMVEDTPILAAAHGWVQWHGWATGGWGNLLRIEHWDGHVSWYAHLNSFREYMANGQYVRHGCLQAYSGNTGASTGPHLHFEVRLNNQSVWIRTLPTTVWNTGDPFNPCSSGNDGYAVGPSSPCFYPSLNSVILPAGDR